MKRLSVDIGGTFTDVVLDQGEQLATTKVLTTYDDPARGVMQGIDQVLAQTGVVPNDIDMMLHGTTLATNALIERRGAVTALLTTEGHRDVLEMAFENRFDQYDVNIDRSAPLVPRALRLGVGERIAADGSILVPMNLTALDDVLATLDAQEVTSVAIGLLHSYANPKHEQDLASWLAQQRPNLSLSLSSEVCPEIREYERLSTTVANAYVRPVMATYLASLAEQLSARGFRCQVLMMTSGGGLTTLETAARFPIRLVESGPAGGAMLAAHLAREHSLDRVLSFDMGGTTAKICLIDDGQPLQSRAFEVDRSYRFKKGSGLPVRIPVIEMVEIGAGGGSIAHVDALKRLQMGPHSAGSEPGPACYGRGGTSPTVTDADVVLGKLSPNHFAGGQITLDVPASQAAVSQHVATELDLDVDAAAFTMAEVVDENMASAARAHAAEWGKELEGRALIAFGGAAPLHAVSLAKKLKIDRVLIPPGAGVGSALGFLLAPIQFEVVRSLYTTLDGLDSQRIEQLFQDMRSDARAVVEQAVGQRVLTESCQAYMRYLGQGYEVAVTVDADLLTDSEALRLAFEQVYLALYGRVIPNMPVEILSWTLSLSTEAETLSGQIERVEQDTGQLGSQSQRSFDGRERYDSPLLSRNTLSDAQLGPALVVEGQTTTVVPKQVSIHVLEDGSLMLNLNAERSA